MRDSITIAIAGGTGAEGTGLALRFARAGARVRIGSRTVQKAQAAAERIAALAGAGDVSGHANSAGEMGTGLVILTVPLAAHAETLKSMRFTPGAILVDATVPLEAAIGGRVSRTLTLWDGSDAQQAARLVSAGVRVVSAFHSLSAASLARLDEPLECDTLICGDDADAKAAVREVASLIPGVRALDAGPLDNARLLEGAAALLISLNLRYKVKSSGIRITGIPFEEPAR